MIVHAGDMHFKALGDLVRGAQDREIVIENCIGQRYIGAGSSESVYTSSKEYSSASPIREL